MYRTYKSQGLVLIGVHGDSNWNKGLAAAKEHKISYPIAQADGEATLNAYKITGFPTVFVIDRRGVISAVDPQDLDKAVKAALAKK